MKNPLLSRKQVRAVVACGCGVVCCQLSLLSMNFSILHPHVISILFPFPYPLVFLPNRTQMIVDIIHPGRANVPKSELQEVVGGMYKADAKLVQLFGFRTKFGGGKSTGFCLIYDNENAMMKFEPKYRLIRKDMATKVERSRKAMKEAKNKGKKVRGTGARVAKHKAKRAAANE